MISKFSSPPFFQDVTISVFFQVKSKLFNIVILSPSEKIPEDVLSNYYNLPCLYRYSLLEIVYIIYDKK